MVNNNYTRTPDTITLPNSGTSGYLLISVAGFNMTNCTISVTRPTGTVETALEYSSSVFNPTTGSARKYAYYSLSNISAGDELKITVSYSGGQNQNYMVWAVYC